MLEQKRQFWTEHDNGKYLSWLNEMSDNHDTTELDRLRNNFEFTAINNEQVTEVVPFIIPVILNLLQLSRPEARARMFDLLYSFGAGYSYFKDDIHYADAGLEIECRKQVMYGVSQYFYFLEYGDDNEKLFIADLLELCSRDDEAVRERTRWMLQQLIDSGPEAMMATKFSEVISEL